MSVKHILSLVGNKIGINPNDINQRDVMLRWLNEASQELYDQSDMVGSLVEQVFRVNGNQTISFPADVGTIRACREYNSQIPWHINQLKPRYNQFNWMDCWRNFRLKNKQTLQATVTNQSVGVITVEAVENPPIVVSVSGPTAGSTNTSEDITMTSTSMMTTNAYLDYTSVKKDRINLYDVTLSDVDGKLLTTIPNNQIRSLYQIVDVSSFPWLQVVTGTFDNYMEILYKKTLNILSNDDDEFLTGEYDYILTNKVLQLWNEEQGKSEIALAYDAKATRSLARKHEEQNRETEDAVSLVANPFDTINRRIGTGLRRRWGSYNGYGR